MTINIPTYLLHLISLIIYKLRSVIRFGAFQNRYILTKRYCSSFAAPLRYWAFSSTNRISCANKMYPTSHMFSYITSHILTYLWILWHLNDVYRSNNILKYNVYGQWTLKSTISVTNSNSYYAAIILYTCCVHSDKNILSRWLINAYYFNNIKIYIDINVHTILTLFFDMLNRIQYSH